MAKYSQYVSTKQTPQSEAIPGSNQAPNSAGGYSWEVTDETRVERFLILGSEGGSYYASERKLTTENAEAVIREIKRDGLAVVRKIVEISAAGRAPKNDPALFALALAVKYGDEQTRRAAYAALNRVARTGTHHLMFQGMLNDLEVGWGRSRRRATGNWFVGKSPDKLAYQLAKYRQRGGWSQRDLLRLSHPVAPTPAHQSLFHWVTHPEAEVGELPQLIRDFDAVQKAASEAEVIRIISGNPKISHEMVPTQFTGSAKVWEALLPNLEGIALIRNLGRMTANGLLAPNSEAVRTVASKLMDREMIKRSRIHPIGILGALTTYRLGHGARGKLTWEPVPRIVDALDGAFYLSFGNVRPTGKRFLLALDVSGSMGGGEIAGMPGLTPRVGSAAMALVTAKVESDYHFMGFSHYLMPLNISPRQRLDDVVEAISGLDFGGTDCALPMTWASQNNVPVDTFVVYTDSETWAGDIHPAQALRNYRRKMGIPAKLVVVGMVANPFTIADPNDVGMLDVVGFDTATPNLISDFATDGAHSTSSGQAVAAEEEVEAIVTA